MFTIEPDARYQMPIHFGPRPVGPHASGWYHDVTAMTVSYTTDPDRLAGHLPAPFGLGEEATITVSYARNRQVDWLAGHGYNMIAVTAAAVFNGRDETVSGQYTLVIWENLADPILTGRELQGIPKVYADIPDHNVIAGRWNATASHFGHTIVDMSITEPRELTEEEIAAGLAVYDDGAPMGWRFLPGLGGLGHSISEPTTFPSSNEFTSVKVGEGRIDWHELTWEQNPTQFHIVNALAGLPVLEYGPAVITEGRTNLVLPDRLPRALS